MLRDQNEADQPALIVTYGNTNQKRRPLDSDILVLGRKPGCDFTLVSPEVAIIHCVIVHAPSGWKIRDCSGGRPGTRVNGRFVQETRLEDGDIIQVGNFSFEAHLPNVFPQAIPLKDPAKIEASRKRFAQLAIRLRRRVADRALWLQDAAARQFDLDRREEAIKEVERDFELRVKRLELSERDLATDRSTLEKEYKAYHEDVERLEERDKTMKEQAVRQEKEVAEKEAALAKREEQLAWVHEKGRELDSRKQELDQYAAHLRRQQRETSVPAEVQQLADQRSEMGRLLEEMRSLVESLRASQRQTGDTVHEEVRPRAKRVKA